MTGDRGEFRAHMKAAAAEFDGPRGLCPAEDELIRHYRSDLEDATRQRMESHLVQCAACRQKLLDVREFFEPLREGEIPAADLDVKREWKRMRPRMEPIGLRSYLHPAVLAVAASLLVAFGLSLGWGLLLQDRLREEQTASERRLRKLEEENRKLIAELRTPQVNGAILDVFSEEALARTARQTASNRIVVAAGAPVTLILNGAGLLQFPDYAVEIVDSQGRVVWRAEGIKRGSQGNFVIGFGADSLSDGEYRFRLFGKANSGHQKIADYNVAFTRRPAAVSAP